MIQSAPPTVRPYEHSFPNALVFLFVVVHMRILTTLADTDSYPTKYGYGW